jgi:DUF4097 and DUF4098 domain-containing protein YvlB
MKNTLALGALTLAVCAAAIAQDDSGRMVIQGHGGSKPRQVNVTSHNGPVTVKAYSGNDLALEPCGSHARAGRAGRRPSQVPDGMHRLNLGGRDVEVEEQDNVFTVRGTGSEPCITLSVPIQTSVKVEAHNGSVNIEGVHGDIEVDSHNGHVTLTNVSGTANVSSRNGIIVASMDQVGSGKPTSFSGVNGKIDITLPADLRANLKLKALQGDIWTDFDVLMSGARPSTQAGNSSNGKYKVTFDRTIMGTINGGGVDITLNTLNGPIYIHKKK